MFYRVDGGTGEYPVEQGGYVVPCIDLPDRLCFDISEFLRVTLVLPDTGLFTHLLRVGMAGLGQVVSVGDGLCASRGLQYGLLEPLTVIFVLDDLQSVCNGLYHIARRFENIGGDVYSLVPQVNVGYPEYGGVVQPLVDL